MATTMSSVYRSASRSREVVPSDRTVELPELRTSEHTMDKQKPLPTSLQSDFIPEDILLAITNPPLNYDKLGPPSRYRNLSTTVTPHRKVAANVWNYPGRRDKFKHLTKNTPCVCGAGNDISFLYDVPKKEEKGEKAGLFDTSAARAEEEEEMQKKPLALPDTLIPDEYHIVKNKGVMGLEYHEEKFATQPEDHEKHLVQFPSMNPTSRFEVKQLKITLNEMLEKAGVYEEEVELRGPTQMHNLLELIKKEQNIYNIVFHELIRQSSVECLERGELLSDLRDKYSTLLNKVPRQIKGLHEEVLAQRALDRRLTEELLRFKTTICALTCELTNVKEHDVEVTRQAKQAQNELKSALSESQKNAGLLNEYHDLYELQRKRLEKQVEMLGEEREIWSTVAYSLALKVMEEHSLNTSKRLHVSEKAWCKLAHHFTVLLSDSDTVVLTALQGYVDKWRDLVDDFNTNMCQREEEMKAEMKAICTGLSAWARDFEKHHLNSEGYVQKPPDITKVTKLYNDLKGWEQTMAQESEKFGGDTVLSGQEYITLIRNQMYAWTDSAMTIFSRHMTDDGRNHPDQDDMLKMNEEMDLLLGQFNVRLTGENGVATGIIYINNGLEMWDARFNILLHGSNPLPDSEWLRFYQQLDEWSTSMTDTITMIGTTQKEEHKRDMLPHRNVEVPDVMRMTHKWVSSTINGIDSEDAKLVEAVGNLHTEQVKWMVQMLLRLAPDQESHSEEAKEAVLLGSTTIPLLQSNAKSLFSQLSQFTTYVTRCCKTIVIDDMQQKIDARQENVDIEYKALNRLGMECNEWVEVAKMMLTDLTGETFSTTPIINLSAILAETKPSTTDEDDLMSNSKPSTAQQRTPEVSYHDKEKLESLTETNQTGSEKTEDEAKSTAPEGAESPDSSTNKKTGTPADQEAKPQSLEDETTNQEAGPQEETANEDAVNQSVDMTVAETEVVDEEPTEASEMAAPEPEKEQIEVIGYDSNTRKKVLDQNPDDAPPHEGTTVAKREGPATPDTKKAYEALAALESLQMQLISTEERAQGAESKAATMEAQLKQSQERIRALERQFGVKPEPIKEEPPTNQQEAPPVATTPDKTPEKTEKPKVKPKDKSSATSRSSSRSSNKSKKK